MRQKMKSLLSLVLVVCAICVMLPIDAYASNPLSVIWLNKKYDKIAAFKNGMATVHKDQDIAFIDKTGKEITPFYNGIVINEDGMVLVTQDYEKWGLINNKGKLILPMVYEAIGNISEGLMCVNRDGKVGFVDETGKVVVPLKYDAAMNFEEGLAPVGVKVSDDYYGSKWGFIDKTGKVVISLKYTDAHNFSEGLAWVAVGDGYNLKYGAIDKTGKVVIPFQYDNAGDFKNGVANVLQYGSYFYIDKTGKKLPQDQQYLASLNFKDGLAKEFRPRDGYVYIDESGKEICPPAHYIRDFSEGLAVVGKGMKYGYIDKTGKQVVPFIYDGASDFSEGLALVYTGNKPGFIDKKGNMVLSLDYDRADDFNEGLAIVRTGMYYGVIDKTGKEIVPPIYQYISTFKEGFAVVKGDKAGRGIINQKGEVVLPLMYDSITDFNEGVAYVTLGDKTGIVVSSNSYIFDLPKEAEAKPLAYKVMVNGKEVTLEAYTIDGRNYLKLRDLGYALNGSEKQFDVLWDNSRRAINIATNNKYVAVGGEMVSGDGKSKKAILSTSDIYKDDSKIIIRAYSINGSSYFELDKIAEILDFAVNTDNKAKTISIDIGKGYNK